MKFSMKLRAALAAVILANKNLSASLTGAKTEFTADEQATFDANVAKAKNLKSQITTAEAQEALEAEAEVVTPTIVAPSISGGGIEAPAIRLPAGAGKTASLKNFKTEMAAYRFGVFACSLAGFPWAKKRAAQLFDMNALQSEGVNIDGGFMVPEEFGTELIDLREKKGVFRQHCRIIPMSRDTFSMPRRATGLTAYFVDEGVAGTVSTATRDRVSLTAKKLMVLATVTKELDEDAIVSIGDWLMGEMAYALAAKEDDCGFNGDGTSTYGMITGLKNALGASCKVTQITSNTWAAQVLADINALMAKIPDYTIPLDLKFYCNKAYFHSVLERLAMASGGASATEIVNGVQQGKFFGYPVIFVSSMPRVSATTGIVCYFGDLGRACKMGVRRGVTMSQTDQGVVGGVELFTTDEIGLKATERFDINVHERGTSTASDAGGPIAALITG